MKIKKKFTGWKILFPSFFAGALLTMLVGCGSTKGTVEAVQEKIPVKVVIVTMFGIGEDEGDQAGEFQPVSYTHLTLPTIYSV